MGGSVSTAVSKLQQTTINEAKSTGSASAQCNQAIDGSDIIIGGDMEKECSISIRNECIADATVAMDTVVKAATKALNETDAKTKGGFGLSASSSVTETESFVRNSLESSCNTDSKIDQSLTKGIRIGGNCKAPIEMVNLGNAKAQCMMTAAVDAINENMQSTESTGKGTSVLGAIAGPGAEGDPDYNNPLSGKLGGSKAKKMSPFFSSYSSCCMCVCMCALGGLGLSMSMGKKKKDPNNKSTGTKSTETTSTGTTSNDNVSMAKDTVGMLDSLKDLIPGRRRSGRRRSGTRLGIKGGMISQDTVVSILSNKWVYLTLILLSMFMLLNVSESPLFKKQNETQEAQETNETSPQPTELSAPSKFDTHYTFL
jgi:hypothetical protein